MGGAAAARAAVSAGRPPWWLGTRGEWWVVVQLVLLALVAILPPAGPRLVPRSVMSTSVALIVGGAGLVMLVSGAKALGRSLTILPRPREDAEFVSSGVYRWIRHPIYTGVILTVIAWAVYRGSLRHVVLAAGVALFFAVKARREERWLVARFPAYEAYRRRTGSFLPRVY